MSRRTRCSLRKTDSGEPGIDKSRERSHHEKKKRNCIIISNPTTHNHYYHYHPAHRSRSSYCCSDGSWARPRHSLEHLRPSSQALEQPPSPCLQYSPVPG